METRARMRALLQEKHQRRSSLKTSAGFRQPDDGLQLTVCGGVSPQGSRLYMYTHIYIYTYMYTVSPQKQSSGSVKRRVAN